MMRLGIFFLTIFGNLWIYKIFSSNILLAILTFATSIVFYSNFANTPPGRAGMKRSSERTCLKGYPACNKVEGGVVHSAIIRNTKYHKLFYLLFALLFVFQWKTTVIQSLTNLTNDQQRVQQMRLRQYPPINFSIAKKTVWIPIAHWFEGRKESIAFFRLLTNFSEVVDPNLYFFANHPRERIGVDEFEKFPYILMPFFIYGMVVLFEQRKHGLITVGLMIPLILVTAIGHNNPIGPFSLFPFFIASISLGIERAYLNFSKKFGHKMQYLVAGTSLVFILIFVQTIAYANF